jgi:FkbM family methyltransferase
MKRILNILRKYIRLHISYLLLLYKYAMYKTDKKTFAVLFNIKAFLVRSEARLIYDGTNFNVTDKKYSWFSFKIRSQYICDTSYQNGLLKRTEYHSEVYFLKKIGFKDGDIFIDCGANVGDLKLWFILNCININYIGFEPSPVEFSCLQENVKPSKVHNVGLWKDNGELKFYISSQPADSSLIEPVAYDEVITTKVCRLDSFIDTKIKCLKLEAEGAEPEILEGLGDKLKLVEFITADLGYERGVECESTLAPVTNFLLQNNFELVDVEHKRICALFRNKGFL